MASCPLVSFDTNIYSRYPIAHDDILWSVDDMILRMTNSWQVRIIILTQVDTTSTCDTTASIKVAHS